MALRPDPEIVRPALIKALESADPMMAAAAIHTYAEEGSYAVTVTLTDVSPGTDHATAHSTANVADAPLSGSIVAAPVEGGWSGTVATFSGGPPVVSTLLNALSTVNPTYRLSRDQNGVEAPSVPGTRDHSCESNFRNHTPSRALSASLRPSRSGTAPSSPTSSGSSSASAPWSGSSSGGHLALYAAVKEGEYAKFMGETFPREYAWYL